MKQLVITADDFGLAQALDEGVKQSCTEGVVTNVSLVANGETIGEAGRFLASHPEVSAGIHLNLTDGKPLTDSPTLRRLVDREGNFLGSHWKAAQVCLLTPRLKGAIELEFRAQVERVLGLGVRALQLNCHGHLHAIPPFFRQLAQIASEYQIPFVRVSEEWPPLRLFLQSPRQVAKTFLLSSSFKVARRWTRVEDRPRPNLCFGLFDSGHLTLERFKAILLSLPEGFSELVCHPGAADEATKRCYRWNYHWDRERQLMTSPETRETIKRLGIQLTNFCEIKKALS